VALTGKTTPRQVAIPHEQGQWMSFRRLPWPVLLAAEQKRTAAAIKNVAELGSEVREMFQSATPRAAAPELKEKDPADTYDRAIILRAGIVAWSYEAEVDTEAVDDLDEETADWAFREILKPAVRSEEERTDRFFPAP